MSLLAFEMYIYINSNIYRWNTWFD